MIGYKALLGSNVISSDAFMLGDVDGLKYDSVKWEVESILVTLRKGMDKLLDVGKSNKVMIPKDAVSIVNDVVLLSHPLEALKGTLVADNPNMPNLSHVSGKNVISSDGHNLGKIYDFQIDASGEWPIGTFSVRLDKEILGELGIKKPLFNRPPDIRLEMSMIRNVTEMAQLDADMVTVREVMTVGE